MYATIFVFDGLYDDYMPVADADADGIVSEYEEQGYSTAVVWNGGEKL